MNKNNIKLDKQLYLSNLLFLAKAGKIQRADPTPRNLLLVESEIKWNLDFDISSVDMVASSKLW